MDQEITKQSEFDGPKTVRMVGIVAAGCLLGGTVAWNSIGDTNHQYQPSVNQEVVRPPQELPGPIPMNFPHLGPDSTITGIQQPVAGLGVVRQ